MQKHLLENLIDEKLSIRQIAAKTGKSATSIRYWMRKYSLSSKWSQRSWSDNKLKELVPESKSVADVLRGLGLDPRGANYKSVGRRIKALELDTSHFNPFGKNCFNGKGRPIEYYLIKDGPPIASSKLRKRLLREKLIDEECAICKLGPKWKGKPLTLRLDHINGDSADNRRINLRIVCPNCDAQLPTFCRGNRWTVFNKIKIDKTR